MRSAVNMSPANRRAAIATFVKRLVAAGVSALAGVTLTGCITILPQWRPAVRITSFDAYAPIILQSGNDRFVLLEGYLPNNAGGYSSGLFLQRIDAAGRLVGSPVAVTNASSAVAVTRADAAERNGWLYVVWEQRYSNTESAIMWAKVNTTTLQPAVQTRVSEGLSHLNEQPRLAVRPNGTSVVVWKYREPNSPTTGIYYRQVQHDGVLLSSGAVLVAPVSTSCWAAGLGRPIRLTLSWDGARSQIAWIGATGVLYWREVDNLNNAPGTCFIASEGLDYAGVVESVDMAVNSLNGDSYLAWTYRRPQNAPSNRDVYYRRVKYSASGLQLCRLHGLSSSDTEDEFDVRIAAGHDVRNWAHLIWVSYPLYSARRDSIRYALVEDTNCNAAPSQVDATLYTATQFGVVAAESPQIAVAQNAVIASLRGYTVSSLRCGTNAADAVSFSFLGRHQDGLNSLIHAGLFQVAEVLDSSTNFCARVVSAQYPQQGGVRLQPMWRSDYRDDSSSHHLVISPRGLPTIAWVGRSSEVNALAVAYVAEAKFSTYLPIARRP